MTVAIRGTWAVLMSKLFKMYWKKTIHSDGSRPRVSFRYNNIILNDDAHNQIKRVDDFHKTTGLSLCFTGESVRFQICFHGERTRWPSKIMHRYDTCVGCHFRVTICSWWADINIRFKLPNWWISPHVNWSVTQFSRLIRKNIPKQIWT